MRKFCGFQWRCTLSWSERWSKNFPSTSYHYLCCTATHRCIFNKFCGSAMPYTTLGSNSFFVEFWNSYFKISTNWILFNRLVSGTTQINHLEQFLIRKRFTWFVTYKLERDCGSSAIIHNQTQFRESERKYHLIYEPTNEALMPTLWNGVSFALCCVLKMDFLWQK